MRKRSYPSLLTLFFLLLLITSLVCCSVSHNEAKNKVIRVAASRDIPYSLEHDSLTLSAESAVLINADNGSILYSKNPDKRMGMASTTKIMTALIAAKEGELDKVVEVSPDAVGVEGSSIYLYAGERITLYDLLCAMLLESANDAAAAIAIELCGSTEAFCHRMNEEAKALGLENTSFKNPHGLYDEEHYTTAYELALIGAEALKNDTIRSIVSTKKAVLQPINEGGVARVLYNHNKMLSLYDGAIGIKTGFTKKTGRCLVSAAEKNGLTLVAVTLNAPDDWNDHKKMLDAGFDNFESFTPIRKDEAVYTLDVIGGREMVVPLVASDDVTLCIPKGEEAEIDTVIELRHRYAFAPIKKGDAAGTLKLYYGGEELAETELFVGMDIEKSYERGKRKLKDIFADR